MKSADIKVGEEYAVGRKWESERSRYDGGRRRLRRARVVETRVPLRTNAMYGGATNKSGVKVEWVDPEHKSREPLVPSREVHQLWAEYEAEEKAWVEVKAKSEAAEYAKYSAAVERIESVLPEDMLFGDVPQKFRGLKSWQIEPLADLLESVFMEGAAAERGTRDYNPPG